VKVLVETHSNRDEETETFDPLGHNQSDPDPAGSSTSGFGLDQKLAGSKNCRSIAPIVLTISSSHVRSVLVLSGIGPLLY